VYDQTRGRVFQLAYRLAAHQTALERITHPFPPWPPAAAHLSGIVNHSYEDSFVQDSKKYPAFFVCFFLLTLKPLESL